MALTIECSKRAEGAKPKALRREGLIPAVLYGHDGTNSVDLTVSTHEAEALLRQLAGKKAPVNVSIPDISWSGEAVLQEVQKHPWK